MAKRVEVQKALGEQKKNWECVMFPEEYHVWNYQSKWDPDKIKASGLEIHAIEVKASKSSGTANIVNITKKEPLRLKCGTEITNGRFGLTTQCHTARFCLRVDSINELNAAMAELSLTHGHTLWEVSKLEAYNPKLAAKLFYEIHSPDGVETRLYLKSAETPEYSKSYESINLYEQQRLCNNFYPYFASCTFQNKVVQEPTCAVKKYKFERTPQKGWRGK